MAFSFPGLKHHRKISRYIVGYRTHFFYIAPPSPSPPPPPVGAYSSPSYTYVPHIYRPAFPDLDAAAIYIAIIVFCCISLGFRAWRAAEALLKKKPTERAAALAEVPILGAVLAFSMPDAAVAAALRLQPAGSFMQGFAGLHPGDDNEFTRPPRMALLTWCAGDLNGNERFGDSTMADTAWAVATLPLSHHFRGATRRTCVLASVHDNVLPAAIPPSGLIGITDIVCTFAEIERVVVEHEFNELPHYSQTSNERPLCREHKAQNSVEDEVRNAPAVYKAVIWCRCK